MNVHKDMVAFPRVVRPSMAMYETWQEFAQGIGAAKYGVDWLTASYLVVLGDPSAAIGLAAVDASSGEATQWATLPGAGPHPLLDRDAAIERTGAPSARRAELVWRSSPASRSPLYPLWEIDTGDQVVYVDHVGRVWSSLEAGARGG